MTQKTWIVALITALGTIGGTFVKGCVEKYSVEIHVSRIWGPNETLPERLR